MKITAKLAYSQLKIKRNRTKWTLLGIMFSTAMFTVMFGFMASAEAMMVVTMGDNYYDRAYFMTSLAGLATVFGTIVIAVSVVVISNAFRVSAGERTAQFGILKSVGATKKQIAAIVMHEGLWLSAIGIPGGIILGMLLHLAGIQVANYYFTSINQINYDADVHISFSFVSRWWAFTAMVIFSLLTVLISAWLPARKAAKIAAIDAIRGSGGIRIKAKNLQGSSLIQKLFGFEGALASKSLKRSHRNFRATVISLSISIILIVLAHSIGIFGFNATDAFYPADLNVNAVVEYVGMTFIFNEEGDITGVENHNLEYEVAEQITSKLREYPDVTVQAIGSDYQSYQASLPADMVTDKMRKFIGAGQDEYHFNVSLITLDTEHYEQLCELAGVPYGANILLNRSNIDGDRPDFETLNFTGQTINLSGRDDDILPLDLKMHGAIKWNDVAEELLWYINGIGIIVPEYDVMRYDWICIALDDQTFIAYADDIVRGMLPPSESYEILTMSFSVMAKAIDDMRTLILTFLYAFVGMLTLIGLTNVISTISTNIRSRSREFAVLRSVGMTDNGLKKMMNLECILSSAKALLFGLPLGLLASYLSYRSIIPMAYIPYVFPWAAIIQCVFGVFAITWVTMRHSVSRMRGQNIVETIRSAQV